MATLDEVFAAIPPDLGINLQLRYTRGFDARANKIGSSTEINEFADTVLHGVYEAGKSSPGRKIIFSSFDPTVCTALNWKQPNCEWRCNGAISPSL
jgi:CDK inhibitor PHO81